MSFKVLDQLPLVQGDQFHKNQSENLNQDLAKLPYNNQIPCNSIKINPLIWFNSRNLNLCYQVISHPSFKSQKLIRKHLVWVTVKIKLGPIKNNL